VVRLRGVSPLIVRTIELPAEATLDVLHEALLVCLDWSGEHLHAFTIRAVDYSSARWMVRDRFDKAGVNRRLHELEVRSCVSSSRSG
jgi:Plasmid pRiA4b ORF-3-like protein